MRDLKIEHRSYAGGQYGTPPNVKENPPFEGVELSVKFDNAVWAIGFLTEIVALVRKFQDKEASADGEG